jgi:hypothetical protein
MRGWTNPNATIFSPTITALSSDKSPATLETIVAIIGTNFRPYSIIKFGKYTPQSIFINSELIEFYVPLYADRGQNPVQIYNGTVGSNIFTFQVDDAVNFWGLDIHNQIYNNNNNNGLLIKGTTDIMGNLNIVNGITTYSSSSTFSDYRIKEIIEPLNDNYTVDNLKPIKYLNKLTGKTEIGFIAHEVQQEFPYLVTGKKDGEHNQSLNYTGLIGVLVHEIQQLKTEIIKLKQK